jgi:hypothetical protein
MSSIDLCEHYHVAQSTRVQSDCISLTFLLAQAELAERDFTAERGEAIVVSTGAVDPVTEAVSATKRQEAEERNRHRCRSAPSDAPAVSRSCDRCLHASCIKANWGDVLLVMAPQSNI